MRNFRLLYFALFILFTTSCNTLLIPKNQVVNIKKNSTNSISIIDYKDTISSIQKSLLLKKSGSKQIITIVNGYKNHYSVLFPFKKNSWTPILSILTIVSTGFYGIILEALAAPHKGNTYSYADTLRIDSPIKYPSRSDKQCFINFLGCKTENTNLKVYEVEYCDADNLHQLIQNTKISKSETKFEVKEKSYSNLASTIIYNDLKKYGYLDTNNYSFFTNPSNEVRIEALIKDISLFDIIGNTRLMSITSKAVKAKVNVVWLIKNQYNEIIDSIITNSFSGEFAYPKIKDGTAYIGKYEVGLKELNVDAVADAIETSYIELLNNSKFLDYLNKVKNQKNTYLNNENITYLNNTFKNVSNLKEAVAASVTIKRKDEGHGSGFVISSDGYIITNYHVIADKYESKYSEIKVLLGNEEEEIDAKVIKIDKENDLALLKIDKLFNVAFLINNTPMFNKLEEVYAIGTPQFIKLEKTVNKGILSNYRKNEYVNLYQLSINVNAGNSGGALVDKNGKLIGVIESKLVGFATEGIGFAVPSNIIIEKLNLKYQ